MSTTSRTNKVCYYRRKSKSQVGKSTNDSQAEEESKDSCTLMMSSGGYDFDFVEQPPDKLTCSKCQLLLRDPQLTSCCGHHFCQTCITRILVEWSPCPLCKEGSFSGQAFSAKGEWFGSLVSTIGYMSAHGLEWWALSPVISIMIVGTSRSNASYVTGTFSAEMFKNTRTMQVRIDHSLASTVATQKLGLKSPQSISRSVPAILTSLSNAQTSMVLGLSKERTSTST